MDGKAVHPTSYFSQFDQIRYAVVVITFAIARIATFTGNGSDAAPAACAASACAISSMRIWSTMARDLASYAGSSSRWLFRWASTWRSVSTTKPRLTGSPIRAATLPIT